MADFTTSIEFYAWCEAQKSAALIIAASNPVVEKRVLETKLPLAQYFACDNGFLKAPGFTTKVILERAEWDADMVQALTVLQNEGKLYQ